MGDPDAIGSQQIPHQESCLEVLSGPMKSPQHLPGGDQLLDCCRWWELAGEGAISMCILVDLLNAGYAQHRQTPGVVCQFFLAEDRLWIGAAGHNWILSVMEANKALWIDEDLRVLRVVGV